MRYVKPHKTKNPSAHGTAEGFVFKLEYYVRCLFLSLLAVFISYVEQGVILCQNVLYVLSSVVNLVAKLGELHRAVPF